MALLSLIARCRRTGQIGLANFADRRAIGSRVGRIREGVGACTVQGVINPRHEKWALDLLSQGVTPHETLLSSTLKDKFRAHRQILLMSASGEAEIFTGGKIPKLAASAKGRNWATGGTGLPSKEPANAVADFLAEAVLSDLPIETLILGGLEAASLSGLSLRGEAQSANLLVLGGDGQIQYDLRVDAGPRPISDLRHLLDQAHREREAAPMPRRTERARRNRAA